MTLNDQIFAEAINAAYMELLLRLSPKERKPFEHMVADEGFDDVVAFIKDNPPEEPNAFHAAFSKMEEHLAKKFPGEDYEVETAIMQVKKRAGL